MNPFSIVTRPVRNLTQAVLMPFKALFVVGLCFLINWMTSPSAPPCSTCAAWPGT